MLRSCVPWSALVGAVLVMAGCETPVENLPSGKNPDLVARVMRGELTKAKASWWGFDAADSTAALQAAIRSRVPELIIDRQATPWMVTPLEGVSDQTLRLEPGTVVMAKEGAFKEQGDSLLTFASCTNVVLTGGEGSALRMRRSDYHDKKKYKWSEWRHALNLLSVVNMRIENLTVAESGGDGLYLGIDWRRHGNTGPCRNVVVRNCVFDKNYRQGISVISANGLLIEDTVMQNTWGTPPAAGIDFEPNRPQEEIVDCVMRNCVSENNQGSGYDLVLAQFDATSKPLDIRLENCRSKGNRNGIVYTGQWDFRLVKTLSFARGRIDVVNCEVEDAECSSLVVSGKPAESVMMTFSNCRFVRAKCPGGAPDIQLGAATRCRWWPPVDGLRFDDCTVEQTAVRPWISSCDCKVRTRSVENVSGRVTVVNPSGTAQVQLDAAWRERVFGKRMAMPEFNSVAFDPSRVKVTDLAPGQKVKLSPIQVRGNVRYVFYASGKGRVNFAGKFVKIGKTKFGSEIVVRKLQGGEKKPVAKAAMQADGKRQDFSFDVPAAGFYSLEIPTGLYHAYQLLESDVPVAIDATAWKTFSPFRSTGELWFDVPADAPFGMFVSGSDGSERVAAELFDPSGKSVWSNPSVLDWNGTVQKGAGGLWRIHLGPPQAGVHEDSKIELAGVVAHAFVSDRKYWSTGRPSAGKGDFVLSERKAGAVPIYLKTPQAPSARYAAEELRDYVKKLTGETAVIVTNTPAETVVVIGLDPSLGEDGYRIVEKRGRLVISGGSRGVLYGVYEILERFGGIGWYASWHEVVPKLDRFAVPRGTDLSGKPAFELRDEMWYDTFGSGVFASRLRLNGGWHGTSPAKFGGYSHRFGGGLYSCHTLSRLLPAADYFERHPEYFAERNGIRVRAQPCLSHPDVLKIVTSNVLARIARDPKAKFYGVSQNDNLDYCQCARCAAIDAEEGSHAGTVVRFVNAVADAVAAKYPDKVIETLAYQFSRKPAKTKLRSNVMPCLCSIECDFSQPIATGSYMENKSFRDDIRNWSGQTDRLYIWDYTVNFGHYLQAYPNVNVLQDNLRFFRDNGVRFMYEQGDYHGLHGWFAELKAWLLAKWMWDPDQPAAPLMDRFFRGYYGKAAPLVRRHFDEVQALQQARSRTGRPLQFFESIKEGVCDREFLERSLKLWDEAERVVKGEDPVYGYNVRMGRLSVVYTLFLLDRRSAWATRHPEKFLGTTDRSALAREILARFSEAKKRICVKDDNSLKSTDRFLELVRQAAGNGKVEPSDVAILTPNEFQVDHGRIVDDVSTIGGKLVTMEATHFDWSVYARMKDVAYDDADYAVRVHLRIDRRQGGADGEAFWCGIYDSKNKRDLGMISRRASECADGWAWYDVGTFRPHDRCSVWIGPGRYDRKAHRANPAITALLCDAIEIRRCAKGFKTVVETEDETKAIQAKIDAASAWGGGRVSVGKGDHAIRSLVLKDGVDLHLEAGARLVGSRDPDAYELDLSGRGLPTRVTRRWCNAMIRILGAKDVAVTGEAGSEICGRNCFDAKGEEGFRGPHAIAAFGVTNLLLSGYAVRDAGNFGFYSERCANVTARSVAVSGGHDGFDFFGCRDILIENCRIFSGDDCVAGYNNERLTVRGCEVNSSCSYFRLGGNDILIEDCRGRAPGENPHRWSLTAAEKRLEKTPPAAGRRTTLSVFTFFTGKSVKQPSQNVVFRNCRFSGVERLLHYNLSGNERWQAGQGLADVTFDRVEVDGLLLPLLAYAVPAMPLQLTARQCRFGFRAPVKSLIRGANVRRIALEDVTATDVGDLLMETWQDLVPSVETKGAAAVPTKIQPATEPYAGRSI